MARIVIKNFRNAKQSLLPQSLLPHNLWQYCLAWATVARMNKTAQGSLRLRYAKAVALQREKYGLTQATLAKAVGLSRTYVGRIESGATNVSVETLEKLRTALWLDEADKTPYKAKIAKSLVASRQRAGMSQQRLSELAHVSIPFISAVERTITNTSLDQIEVLAAALAEDPMLWLGLGNVIQNS